MQRERKAKVFMIGRSQAVRLPAEYRFGSNEVYIRRDAAGHVVLSERPFTQSLEDIFAAIDRAGGADELLCARDSEPAQERNWH